MFPPRESSSRDLGQLTTRPPSIHRDPNTRSAWSRAATSWGSCSGACDPSASISRRTPKPRSRPQVKPAMYAAPSPAFPWRCNTSTRGSSALIASAILPVPSGLASSTISTCTSGEAANNRSTIISMLSRSLYVGTMTSTPASVGCGGTGNPYSLLVRYLVYIGAASGPPGDERQTRQYVFGDRAEPSGRRLRRAQRDGGHDHVRSEQRS